LAPGNAAALNLKRNKRHFLITVWLTFGGFLPAAEAQSMMARVSNKKI
jgi:hypothetical protein